MPRLRARGEGNTQEKNNGTLQDRNISLFSSSYLSFSLLYFDLISHSFFASKVLRTLS